MHPITQRKAQVTRTTIQANHIYQLAQLFTRQHPPKTKKRTKTPPLEQIGGLPVGRVVPRLPQRVRAKLRWRAWARLEE